MNPAPPARAAGIGPQRIGLSATQRPLERIGDFLVGAGRECEIVDASEPKQLDLEIVVPVEDMVEPSPLDNKRRDGADTGKTPPPKLDTSPERIDPGPIEASLDPATNTRSIWPAIYPELLRLVREHSSTIVFVNNRRAAERIAKRLNEMHNDELEEELPATEHAGNSKNGDKAPPEIARAHHGSLSHEERALVEELLKSGQLPCLVATSSLELGIDMGAVDLVIQVESPKSVTRGLQRVGRAGHTLGEVSKGRIFPKFRADLLECAVVARRMRTGEIEETVIPQNPLDVLAQHLVSMAALDEWEIDEVEKLVRSAQPFAELSREQLENVLDMLDGRYPSERFAELRPRIVWDRTKGTMRGRPGATTAGGGQRRDDPRPRPLWRPPPGRPPRRRARRGDGLRGATRPDLPARRQHLADRGDHPRPGDRHPSARHTRSGPLLARRRHRPSRRARQGDRRLQPRGGQRRPEEAGQGQRPRQARRAEPRQLPDRAAGGHPSRPLRRGDRDRALPRRDRRLAALRPLALRRPGARGLGPGARGQDPRRARTWRRTRSGPTTGSSSTCPTPTSRHPATW